MDSAANTIRQERARRRGSLGRRMAFVLLPLVVIPVVFMGSVAYVRTRDILRQQANSQLVSAAESQASTLDQWARTREQRLQLGTQRTVLVQETGNLMHLADVSAAPQESREALRTELQNLQSRESEMLFSSLLIARTSDGLILASTRPEWENIALPALRDQRLPLDALATRPLYDDPVLSPSSASIVTLAPMRITGGQSADSVLIGVNSDLRLGALMQQLQVYWEMRGVYRIERGATYFIMSPDLIIQLNRYATSPEAVAVVNHPVFQAIQNDPSGTLAYTGLDGVPVLGAYEWIPEWGLGVVAELPQADVYADLNSLAPFSIALVAIAALLSVLVVVFVTNRMLRPLGTLTQLADRISHGDWTYRAPEERNDELGALAAGLNRMADDLSGMYQSLEAQVEERTQQIRTAAAVARAVVSTPVLDDLLRRAVELIRDRFSYYHVSIFMLDDEGKSAVLRESTGEVGSALKARGHRLAVGSQSIIGWVTANNEPRVASDVSSDPVHFKNELLPQTRSEAAVPLQVGGTVLGALDVQSTNPGAFSAEDIEVLQTLADQLSAAIQNARLAQASAMAADRSRVISEVTGQFSGILDVDSVLRTAAHALHRALGQPEIVVRLDAGETEQPPEDGGDGQGDGRTPPFVGGSGG
jgi:GAF domain-containing protein/HAMP domain-containing protein